MKSPGIPLACLTLLLGGCALVPAPYSDQLDPVGASYSAIKTGVPRVQVEARLGRPNREEVNRQLDFTKGEIFRPW